MLAPVLLSLALLVGPEQQVTPPDLAPEISGTYGLDAASNGDGWLVVRGEYGVAANRIDRDGNLIERVPISIGDGGYFSSPAVTFGAGRYLVAWTEHDTIRAAGVDEDGNPSPSFLVSARARTEDVRQISCAFDGSRFLIVWSEQPHTMSAAIVDANLNVIATDISLGKGLTSDYFALAGGNSEFLLATAAGTSLAGITIDHNGRVTRRTLGAKDNTGLRPFAAFNGSKYLVLWDRPGLMSLTATGQDFTATIDAAGVLRAVVLDENGSEQRASTIDQMPDRTLAPVAAAWNGAALLVAYVKQVVGVGTVYAKIVDAPGPAKPIVFAPPSQTAPTIAAADEHEALTVWTEHEEVSFGMIARAALLRDGVAGAPIDLGPSGTNASVAFGASTYLAVWARHDGDWFIEGRRVARDGTPLDAAPFVILHTSIAQSPVVAFDGENFVVATVTYTSVAILGSVVAIRVRPDGTVLDPEGIVVHKVNGVQRILNPPLIASSGDSSIILWRESRDMFAATVSRGAAPGGMMKIAGLIEVQPSVAWTGTTYIVTWTDLFAHALRWTALDASGNPAGTPGMLPLAAANTLDPPAVVRLGDGALIAWVDLDARSFDRNILALRVAADGSLLAGPFTVAASELPESAIAAAGGATSVRLAYQRAVAFPGTSGVPRIFTRAVAGDVAPPRRRAVR